MILRNEGYTELAKKVKENEKHIIIYGAGMIGQTIVPYKMKKYGLLQYIDYYVDMDQMKQQQQVEIGTYKYRIRSPEVLHDAGDNIILLITNSKFYAIVDFLDSIPELAKVEGYIIPILQLQDVQATEETVVRRKTKEPIIPKKIHYCWFGRGKMPAFLQDCIKSWKVFCPEYELICWNEDNYDVEKFSYAKEAYEHQKYSFVTDIVRLDILYQYGGIYMDTDVAILRNLDELLYQQAFVGVEKWGNINTGGGIGAIPYHPMVGKMLECRKAGTFIRSDGNINIETNGFYETKPFIELGMQVNNSVQVIEGMTVYPSYVFHPYDYMSGITQIEESTVSIHHFYGGWMDEQDIGNRKNTQNKYEEILKRMNECIIGKA